MCGRKSHHGLLQDGMHVWLTLVLLLLEKLVEETPHGFPRAAIRLGVVGCTTGVIVLSPWIRETVHGPTVFGKLPVDAAFTHLILKGRYDRAWNEGVVGPMKGQDFAFDVLGIFRCRSR